MTKQQIEVDIPDGMEVDNVEYSTIASAYKVYLRPIERWKIPTKLDLLNRDSIECRVRDGLNHDWMPRTLIAVSDSPDCHEKRFYVFEGRWKYCEIRDTEPKQHEVWIRFNANGFHSLCEEKPAFHEGCTIRHFVELQP